MVGGDSATPADEIQAHEVTRALVAAYDAHDPARGGPGSIDCLRRDHHDGSRRGLRWRGIRYANSSTLPKSRLATTIIRLSPLRSGVVVAEPLHTLGLGLCGAARPTVDPAAVAARADVADGLAARAFVSPVTRVGQSLSPEGWTKAPCCPTLSMVVLNRRPSEPREVPVPGAPPLQTFTSLLRHDLAVEGPTSHNGRVTR